MLLFVTGCKVPVYFNVADKACAAIKDAAKGDQLLGNVSYGEAEPSTLAGTRSALFPQSVCLC